jgi:hypothetical protein
MLPPSTCWVCHCGALPRAHDKGCAATGCASRHTPITLIGRGGFLECTMAKKFSNAWRRRRRPRLIIERQPGGKMRITSGSWDGEKDIFEDQVIEVRHANADGRLHVARKTKRRTSGTRRSRSTIHIGRAPRATSSLMTDVTPLQGSCDAVTGIDVARSHAQPPRTQETRTGATAASRQPHPTHRITLASCGVTRGDSRRRASCRSHPTSRPVCLRLVWNSKPAPRLLFRNYQRSAPITTDD